MKFYINQVETRDSSWDYQCIGLFTNNEWQGEGNFCGYYGSEYYLNTTLIAYGIQAKTGNYPYDPLYPFNYVKIVNSSYEKIQIGSDMWEESFECDNEIEALNIFAQQKWRTLNENKTCK